MSVVGIAGGAANPIGLSHQVAKGVVVEAHDPAQGVGGGQPAVKAADLVGGDVAEGVLFADDLVVAVEPVCEAAAFSVVVFGFAFIRVVDEPVVVYAVRSSRGDYPAFGVIGDVDAGGATVLPVLEPAFFGVCVVEFAAEQAVHIGERPKRVVAVADKRFVVAIPCYCFDETFRRGPDDEDLTVAVFYAPQTILRIDEVDAVVVSVFDCRQTADVGIRLSGFEYQGLLAAGIEFSYQRTTWFIDKKQIAGIILYGVT